MNPKNVEWPPKGKKRIKQTQESFKINVLAGQKFNTKPYAELMKRFIIHVMLKKIDDTTHYRHNAVVSYVVQVHHIKSFQQDENEGLEIVCEFTEIINPTISCYLKLLNKVIRCLNYNLINILSSECLFVKSQQIDIGSYSQPSSHLHKLRRKGTC